MQRWEFAEVSWSHFSGRTYCQLDLGPHGTKGDEHQDSPAYPSREERELVTQIGEKATRDLLGWYGYQLVVAEGNSQQGFDLFRRVLPLTAQNPAELVAIEKEHARLAEEERERRAAEEEERERQEWERNRAEWLLSLKTDARDASGSRDDSDTTVVDDIPF
jgi:hypothetical protein